VGDATLTATGSVLGTAHYLSPEQASGGRIGPATDQYSTGIVLYEMLVGTVPFTGDSPVAIAMRHMADELPPPSTVNPEVSPGFDEIVRRATSKDASDRFPDAQAMADALRNELGSSTGGGLVGAGASTGVVGSSTAVLHPTGRPTSERSLTGEWDAQRVGRAVLLSFAALIVIAVGLLAFRLAAGDEEPQRSERPRDGAGAGQAAEDEQEPAQVVIPDDILGRAFDEVSEQLTNELGLNVESNSAPSNDFPTQGVVSAARPEPGSTVSEGDTVTLTISTGPEDSDNEDEDDEDGGPPPGHGPDKPDKEPKPPKDDD
jgi:serine/threonine-protein kinase